MNPKQSIMLFRNKGRYVTTQRQLQINGTILSLVDATTFIGLNIDEKLNWEKHKKVINYGWYSRRVTNFSQ